MKRVLYFSGLVMGVMASSAFAASPLADALHKIGTSICKLEKGKNCQKTTRFKTQPKTKPRPNQPVAPKPADAPIPPEPIVPKAKVEPIPPEPKIDVPAQPKPVIITPAVPLGDCQSQLKAMGVEFTVPLSYGETQDCHVDHPVQISAAIIGNDKISFPDQPILNCKFAQQFAAYIGTSMIKSTGPVAKLYTGPGFVCRNRNGTSKISEHAMGNAVDIEHIQLTNGQTLTIKDAGIASSKDYALLNTIRHAACATFTTVLGPGANADHESHFHFDSGQHGKTGNYRICE